MGLVLIESSKHVASLQAFAYVQDGSWKVRRELSSLMSVHLQAL